MERLAAQLALLDDLRAITAAASRYRAAVASVDNKNSSSSNGSGSGETSGVSLDQYEALDGMLSSAEDLDLPMSQFPVVGAACVLWEDFCLAQSWVEVYVPRRTGGGIPGISSNITANDGERDGGESSRGGKSRASRGPSADLSLTRNLPSLSDLSQADMAASIALLLLFPCIPLAAQATDRARHRLKLVEHEESTVLAPLLRCLAEEALMYDEAAHTIRSLRQMPRPSSWLGAGTPPDSASSAASHVAAADSAAAGTALSSDTSVAAIVSGVSIEHVVSKQTREVFLDARAFLRLRDDLIPSQDPLAVLQFLEAAPPRTPFLASQLALIRAWAHVQLTTVALRECLHQGSIGRTAVPSLMTPVRTTRLCALLDDLCSVNAAICNPDPGSPPSPASASGPGQAAPTSKIRAVVAAAKWALQLRVLFLDGRWAAIETWCGVPGPASKYCVDRDHTDGAATALLPPLMAFMLSDFPAIEVERDNALWHCRYFSFFILINQSISTMRTLSIFSRA